MVYKIFLYPYTFITLFKLRVCSSSFLPRWNYAGIYEEQATDRPNFAGTGQLDLCIFTVIHIFCATTIRVKASTEQKLIAQARFAEIEYAESVVEDERQNCALSVVSSSGQFKVGLGHSANK